MDAIQPHRLTMPVLVTPDHASALFDAARQLAQHLDAAGPVMPRMANDRSGPVGGYQLVDGTALIIIMGALVPRTGFVGSRYGCTGYDGITAEVGRAVDDDAVQRIALLVNSPGGFVQGVDAAAMAIRTARERKPVLAVVDGLACSAAYWLASQANAITVPPLATVGSIGVITAHVDATGAMEKAGVKVTLIHSGDHKADGHPLKPLSDSVRTSAQARVDKLRKAFAAARCSVGVEDLTAKLSAARTAVAEAERRARYDAAAAQAEAASAELRRVYPDAVAKLRALLRQLAEAEIAVAAANRDRPAGAAPLEGPEGFRLGTGMAEKVIRTEDVELWADFRGKPQSPEMQPLIVDDGTGHGRVPQDQPGTGGVHNDGLRKIAFTATTVRPADGFKRVARLAASLTLPPLGPGEQPAWAPIDEHHASKPEGTGAAVLDRLDMLARATPRGPKPVQVRYEVVNPRDLYWDPTMAREWAAP